MGATAPCLCTLLSKGFLTSYLDLLPLVSLFLLPLQTRSKHVSVMNASLKLLFLKTLMLYFSESVCQFSGLCLGVCQSRLPQ